MAEGSPTETVEAAMSSHLLAVNHFTAAQQAFSAHARLGQYAEAEAARQLAVAYLEAGMDAFVRACRLGLSG